MNGTNFGDGYQEAMVRLEVTEPERQSKFIDIEEDLLAGVADSGTIEMVGDQINNKEPYYGTNSM